MKNADVVTLDLGSGFSKVAVRRGWNSAAALLTHAGLASREAPYCIPSVVARISRAWEEDWLIGLPAAAMKPGQGVTIYRNWKARLFADEVDEGLREVVFQFFKKLREELAIDATLPLRVCIPALKQEGRGRELIEQAAHDCGWTLARGKGTVYEPESNALGLLSRGKNATWKPPMISFQVWRGREPLFSEMLEPGLLGPLRQMMEEKRADYGFLITDIGAFTTDFGYVRVGERFWRSPSNDLDVLQGSVPLGVKDLDEEVLALLTDHARAAVKRLAQEEWELLKAQLYSGSSVAVRDPEGGVVYIGTDTNEKDRISRTLERFARRVLSERASFRADVINHSVDAEALTGGGALIAPVRATIVGQLQLDGARIHDLFDPKEPEMALRYSPRSTMADREARARQNLELVRGGSAVGGCSVFFE